MLSDKKEQVSRWPGRWFWLLAVCWMVAVAAYWWQFVPAVPEKVIHYQRSQIFTGHTAAGALVFASPETPTGAFFRVMGPIEVVDPVTGRVLQRIGDEQATVSPGAGSDHVILSRRDRHEVIDLRTGRVVITRPIDQPEDEAALSRDGKLLAVTSGNRVSMLDIQTGEQLWSREFREEEPASRENASMPSREWPAGVMTDFGKFVYIYLNSRSDGDSPSGSWWVNSRTGELELRAADTSDLLESPDGRYVLLGDGHESQLLSLAENRVVCRIPAEPQHCDFNPESTQIRRVALCGGRWRLSRWSIPDGKAIGDVPTGAVDDWQIGGASVDGRKFVVSESDWGFMGSARLTEALQAMGLSKLASTWYGTQDRILQRNSDDDSVLLIASRGWFQEEDQFLGLSVLPIGQPDRFAVTQPGRLLIFRFDPPRNWWWLAMWGMGPVAVVLGFSQWRTRIKSRPPVPAAPVSGIAD